MPQDPKPQDLQSQARSQVNIDDSEDLSYWTQRFGVSEEALRHAVREAGPSAEAVARQLEINWLP